MDRAVRPASSSLIGKAGVGLVMFHLGRLGYEFTQTTDSSRHGDLWVMFDSGPEVVEVKTVHATSWPVRRLQAQRVARFAFVSIEEGECWLADAALVLTLIGAKEATAVGRQTLKAAGARPLHRGIPLPCPKRPTAEELVLAGEEVQWRTVRARLADGSVKEYRYPRRRSGAGK